MPLVCALLALLAAPFWETKSPRDWTEPELQRLMHDSPWAQMADPAPEVQVYLATASPLRDAETELARRRGKPLNEEYVDYLKEHGGKQIILAIAFKNLNALSDGEEARHMEDESVMKVGRQTYKIEGHFPPVPADPVLRLVYPRAVTERDKNVTFELYLPGYGPYHEAQFRVRDLMFKGRLEM
ncbi:MAG: hypothetical protein ABSH50_00700 [Bryobacteraceae bacterium]|jgi:hypothetical protein